MPPDNFLTIFLGKNGRHVLALASVACIDCTHVEKLEERLEGLADSVRSVVIGFKNACNLTPEATERLRNMNTAGLRIACYGLPVQEGNGFPFEICLDEIAANTFVAQI